jgi:hypothetical protein
MRATMASTRAVTPNLDPRELAERWRRARLAALGGAGEELARLEALPPEALAARLDAVGRNSWRLGRSAAAFAGAVDGAATLAALLAGSGIPCVAAGAEPLAAGCRFRREGCADLVRAGTRACDHYREAIDGLVCGLSEKLLHARVASRGHGGLACEDRLVPAGERAARFAPVPEAVREHLAGPLGRLVAQGSAITLLGLEENRLVVRCEGGRSTACGPARLLLDLLASHLAARFPDLELVDATPRAVMA